MPRSRGGARPAARPSGFGLGGNKGQQSRSTSSMAYSAPRTAPPPSAAPSANVKPGAPSAPATPAAGAAGPGLLGQVVSTAAGVALGNVIGGMFSGSGSEAANAEPMAPAAPAQQGGWNNTNNGQANNCGEAAKTFTDCMNASNGDMKPCSWYFEQLKACQSASAPY